MIWILQIFQGLWWKNNNQHSVWPEILIIAFFTFLLGWFVSWLFRKSYRKLWSYNEKLLKDQYLLNDKLRSDVRALTSEKRKLGYELQKSSDAFTELKNVSVKYIREVLQLFKNEMTRSDMEREELFADLKNSQKNNETYLLGLHQSKEKNRELEEHLRGQISVLETEKNKWSGLHDQLMNDFQIQVGNYKQRLNELEGNYDFALKGSSSIRHKLESSEEEKEDLRKELEKAKLKTEDANLRLQIMKDENQTLSDLLHETKNDLQGRVNELKLLQDRLSDLEDFETGLSGLKKINTSLEEEKNQLLQTIERLEAENQKYGVDLNELYHALQLKEQEYAILQKKFLPALQIEQEKQQLTQKEDQMNRENGLYKEQLSELQKEMEQTNLEKSLWEERYHEAEHEKNELLKERFDNQANMHLLHENMEKNNALIKQLEAAGRVVMSERDERKRLTVEHETAMMGLQQKFRNEKQYYEEHIRNLKSTLVELEKKLLDFRSFSAESKNSNRTKPEDGTIANPISYGEPDFIRDTEKVPGAVLQDTDILELNDLKRVYHVTPEVEKLFNDHGILSLNDLSRKTPDQLREILTNAGKHFMYFNCDSWPRQAQLIVEGRQLELDILVNEVVESEKFSLF